MRRGSSIRQENWSTTRLHKSNKNKEKWVFRAHRGFFNNLDRHQGPQEDKRIAKMQSLTDTKPAIGCEFMERLSRLLKTSMFLAPACDLAVP